MRYPNRLLSKNLPLCTCNYPFYSAYNSLNHQVKLILANLSFVEIVVIVRGRDGKRDRSRACQGGLKRYVLGGFVPLIHIGHIKQIERHNAGV